MSSAFDDFKHYEKQANRYRTIDVLTDWMDPTRGALEALNLRNLEHQALEDARRRGMDGLLGISGINSSAAEMISLAAGQNKALAAVAQEYQMYEDARKWSSESLLGVTSLNQEMSAALLGGEGMYGSTHQTLTQVIEAERLAREEIERMGLADVLGVTGKNYFAESIRELVEKSKVPSALNEIFQSASAAQQSLAGLSHIGSAAQQIKDLVSLSEPVWMSQLPLQVLGGAQSLEGYLSYSDPGLAAFETAKNSFDKLMQNLSTVNWDSSLEVDDKESAARRTYLKEMSASFKEQTNFKGVLTQILVYTAWLSPKIRVFVQIRLMMYFCFLLKWSTAAIVTHEVIEVWKTIRPGSSRQEISRQIENSARRAVPSPFFLGELRYVNTRELNVKLNPRAQSSEVGKLHFSNVVHILKRDKDFTLIAWQTNQEGAQLQGWVFSRYLRKFS